MKCVSRRNGLQFFWSFIWSGGSAPGTLASLLGQRQCSRLFCLLAGLELLFADFFSFLIFVFFLSSSLALPTSAASSVRVVVNLTPKFLSLIIFSSLLLVVYYSHELLGPPNFHLGRVDPEAESRAISPPRPAG